MPGVHFDIVIINYICEILATTRKNEENVIEAYRRKDLQTNFAWSLVESINQFLTNF